MEHTGTERGRAFGGRFIKKLAGNSIRIPFHDHRAVLQVWQQPLRYIEVILQEVAFGQTRIRPKYLL